MLFPLITTLLLLAQFNDVNDNLLKLHFERVDQHVLQSYYTSDTKYNLRTRLLDRLLVHVNH